MAERQKFGRRQEVLITNIIGLRQRMIKVAELVRDFKQKELGITPPKITEVVFEDPEPPRDVFDAIEQEVDELRAYIANVEWEVNRLTTCVNKE